MREVCHMRWVIALLMQFGQSLNVLHFNVRLALFGVLLCCIHTGIALALLSRALIPASTAEQVIDFSMSGTVFLLVGITVSGLVATRKGTPNADEHPVPDGRPDKILAGRPARIAPARRDDAADVAGPQAAHAGAGPD
jgi:hypothetical protein